MPKCLDITDQVAAAKTTMDINESWTDYFCWKTIRGDGYDFVKIDGEIFSYCKWGSEDSLLSNK